VHVIAQGLVLRREMNVAAAHVEPCIVP
jgi:hypothetical protein